MRTEQDLDSLSLLGSNHTEYPTDYDPTLLETFDNKHPGRHYLVSLVCPEFTSLCPKTGQPDFAKIIINYIPRVKMVESKSLKLYLFSFRNHGDFHEDCVNVIMKDLIKLMDPKYIEVWGKFRTVKFYKIIISRMFIHKSFQYFRRIIVRITDILISKQGYACGFFFTSS